MTGRMKALLKDSEGTGARLVEVDIPKPGEGEALVKVIYTAICGTDHHIYTWNSWAQENVKLPHILGHEFVGEVVELGPGVSRVRVGDIVSAETHIFCGRCKQCLTGNEGICRFMKILGVTTPGSFAEYIVVPERVLWKNPENIPLKHCAVEEPLGVALEGVLAEDVSGKTVFVTGCGPIGLFAISVAKTSGASKVYASDVKEYRLSIAKEVGADVLLDPRSIDPVEKIMEDTGGDGVDVVIECSGSTNALIQGLNALSKGGRVSLVGLFSREITLELNSSLVFKAARVYGISGRKIFSTWWKVRELLQNGKLNIDPIITHELPLERFEEAMELMEKGECGKILLRP
ncbi:MAG: L-threonine 3-dehydrogenase [Synergistetes bacterium]|nr:L-threonine 3-dehydrogenase [Synergistota bacterium]